MLTVRANLTVRAGMICPEIRMSDTGIYSSRSLLLRESGLTVPGRIPPAEADLPVQGGWSLPQGRREPIRYRMRYLKETEMNGLLTTKMSLPQRRKACCWTEEKGPVGDRAG